MNPDKLRSVEEWREFLQGEWYIVRFYSDHAHPFCHHMLLRSVGLARDQKHLHLKSKSGYFKGLAELDWVLLKLVSSFVPADGTNRDGYGESYFQIEQIMTGSGLRIGETSRGRPGLGLAGRK